jgi:hypothetical protein
MATTGRATHGGGDRWAAHVIRQNFPLSLAFAERETQKGLRIEISTIDPISNFY